MKKAFLLLIILSTSWWNAHAQTWALATLDINQAGALVHSNGDLFWDYSNTHFVLPQDSSTPVIFAGATWLGGLDTSGALHVAAQTYRQTGNDFYPGPVMNAASYSAATDAQWNNVWKISKTTIDTFLLWFANPSVYPGYTVPSIITAWPANGDVSAGQASVLAPYIDRNGDGVYDPGDGDYPCIKGDQALFFIFNDDRNIHTETGGTKMSVEIHGMMYAYSAPGTWLDSTIFINYKLYNRSPETYSEMYWGQWTDFDLGHYNDDYVGCDVQRNIVYACNGDADDGSSPIPYAGTFGNNPPAEGLVFLGGPEADAGDARDNDRDGVTDENGERCMMSHFIFYPGGFYEIDNPEDADDHYNYMKATWKDSTRLKYGASGYDSLSGTPCDFMYPGTSDPLGWGTALVPQAPWSESTSSQLPGDRWAVASTGPFTMEPFESFCLDFAYVYGRGTSGPASGVAVMQNNADSAHAFYAQNNPCDCDENPLGVEQHEQTVIGVYPNPAGESINIICGDNYTGSQVEIIDVNGKVVQTATVLSGNSVIINTSDLSAGIYFVRVNKGSVVLLSKFIRQ